MTTTNPVPLALWPVAQTSAQYQRAGRYHPDSSAHPAKMLPELARRIVSEFSPTGGLVVDPMCGSGTTLVEAARLGRRAVGLELEERWAALARRNLAHALGAQARLAEVRTGDATTMARSLSDVSGAVDLVCTSPPYATDVGVLDRANWGSGGGLCPNSARNYSANRANLGHARGRAYRAALTLTYTNCAVLLREGGLLVVVTKQSRSEGRSLDLAGLTVALARAAGLSYIGHAVALHAAVRGEALVARPSFWQLVKVRRFLSAGEPAHLPVHEDVLVFSRHGGDGAS